MFAFVFEKSKRFHFSHKLFEKKIKNCSDNLCTLLYPKDLDVGDQSTMASHKERMSASAYSTTPGHLDRMTSSAYTSTATNERLGLYTGSTPGQSLVEMTSPACTHTPTNEKERWGLCSSPSLSQSERMPLSACTSPSPGWDDGEAAANWLDYRLLFERERQEKEVRYSFYVPETNIISLRNCC
jgi:hypothetical protein